MYKNFVLIWSYSLPIVFLVSGSVHILTRVGRVVFLDSDCGVADMEQAADRHHPRSCLMKSSQLGNQKFLNFAGFVVVFQFS